MAYIPRSCRTIFAIQDLLSDFPSRSEIKVTLFSNEIRKIQRLYPNLAIKKIPVPKARNKYRCIITKKGP